MIAALALVCTTFLGGCDMMRTDWSASDSLCADRPGKPCQPPPAP